MQKSQRYICSHGSESHKTTKLTTITYMQKSWCYNPCRPHPCRFSSSLPRWAFFSWFGGPCSPWVLHSLWFLQSFYDQEFLREGISGHTQFRLSLFHIMPVSHYCRRKSFWWLLHKAPIHIDFFPQSCLIFP